MSYSASRSKMNTIYDADVHSDLSGLKSKIETTKQKLADVTHEIRENQMSFDTVQTNIQKLEKNINSFRKEIGDRQIHPEWYKVAAGAGTLEHVMKNIEDLEKTVETLKQEAKQYNERIEELGDYDREIHREIDDLEDHRNTILYAIASKIGLENLKNERRSVGKMMSKHYRIQKEVYNLQKERYEDCKNTFGFRPEDREFIERNVRLNQEHWTEWGKLCDKRNDLCELIEVLDPSDIDHGFDEDE